MVGHEDLASILHYYLQAGARAPKVILCRKDCSCTASVSRQTLWNANTFCLPTWVLVVNQRKPYASETASGDSANMLQTAGPLSLAVAKPCACSAPFSLFLRFKQLGILSECIAICLWRAVFSGSRRLQPGVRYLDAIIDDPRPLSKNGMLSSLTHPRLTTSFALKLHSS